MLQFTGLCFAGGLGIVGLGAAVNDQLLSILVEDRKVDLLAAQKRQLHGLLDEALLSLAVGNIPVVVVRNFFKFVNFAFPHFAL